MSLLSIYTLILIYILSLIGYGTNLVIETKKYYAKNDNYQQNHHKNIKVYIHEKVP